MLRELGRGGMGTVYEATDRETGERERRRMRSWSCWHASARWPSVLVLLRLVPVALRLGNPAELAHARVTAAVISGAAGLSRLPTRLVSEATAAIRHADDPPSAARVAQYKSHLTNFLGDPCAAVREMQQRLEGSGHALENLDYLTAVADTAGNLMLRGHAHDALRWVALGVTRANIEGDGNLLAHGHTYRCYAGPLLALLGRDAEARGVIDDFGETLRDIVEDPWRRGQWLAHRALLFAELGGDLGDFESVVRELHSLGLSPRAVPLQLRHFYIAQAMVRLAEHDGSAAGERRWRAARVELARAAGKHPTHHAHLRALEAAYHAWKGDSRAAAAALADAARLAQAHDNLLVQWDVARQRALACTREGDALGARHANEMADAIATGGGWAPRRARLLAAVNDGVTDPRWPYGQRCG